MQLGDQRDDGSGSMGWSEDKTYTLSRQNLPYRESTLEKPAQHCIREEMLVSLHSAHFTSPSEQQVVTVFNC